LGTNSGLVDFRIDETAKHDDYRGDGIGVILGKIDLASDVFTFGDESKLVGGELGLFVDDTDDFDRTGGDGVGGEVVESVFV